ncbi:MAG: suppressor of fused domain protein [Candidatus Acidiferrales bacterium]
MPHVPTPIRYLSSITNHIEKHFGTDFFVLHEEKSSTVHVDVHVVRPTRTRPFFTLLTSGMSDLDMKIPKGLDDLALAEVCLCLPPDWPLAMDDFRWREPQYFWPIRILKQAALYPHTHQTWFSWGHTVGSADQPRPLSPETNFTGIILLHPATFPEGAAEVETEDGRTIHYLAAIPLLLEEMTFQQTFGADALEEKLIEADITELLRPKRLPLFNTPTKHPA